MHQRGDSQNPASTTTTTMSKLCCGSLLLILLAVIWCDYSVESRRWISPNRLLKDECKCRVLANKKVSCRKDFSPKTMQERFDMLKCLCKKHYNELEMKMDADFQKACKKIFRDVPIPQPLS
ncbi:hypothetical protein MATL_G00175080 [Megalops atlanticus]|uniref:Uncharacterized protein n=1 Tax=Megalops atlanticus TaxID=7932 RepID=A0A9D3PRS7_MEGAT|nr:hypothetical protein MATL_G00175080 [Megalops atlanticus]